MKSITILASENTAASSIYNPADLFTSAGRLWHLIQGQKPHPLFQVNIVSQNGHPVSCFNGLSVQVHSAMDEIEQTDLILVSSIFDVPKTLPRMKPAVKWLKQMYQRGTEIGSVCTGAFVLAETGLLNGKHATTHWGMATAFEKRYPEIRLDIQKTIIDNGDLYCAGGTNASLDLTLYLIEKYCGRETALQCAKVFLHDPGRNDQTPYTVFSQSFAHADEAIKSSQTWLLDRLHVPVETSEMSKVAGLSLRTFERRFKKATGETPLTYVQKLRVESAKHLLESTQHSFDEIAYQLGYQNTGAFRKVFVKYTQLLPSVYRNKFKTSPGND